MWLRAKCHEGGLALLQVKGWPEFSIEGLALKIQLKGTPESFQGELALIQVKGWPQSFQGDVVTSTSPDGCQEPWTL